MPRIAADNVRVNLLMPPKIVRAAKTLARRSGITLSEFIRNAVVKHAVAEGKRTSK